MENIEKNLNNNIEHIKKMCFWRSAFFGLIILIAGIAIGGASMSIVASRDKPQETQRLGNNSLMPRLSQILGLQQQQVSKIGPIIDEHMQYLYEIREDARVEIADTLDEMNNEVYPLLNELQKRRWSNELLRIQRELSPEPGRGGRGARRGAGQGGQGAGRGGTGQGAGGRIGRTGQLLNQRSGTGQRRAGIFQNSPVSPNSINDNLNINDMNE